MLIVLSEEFHTMTFMFGAESTEDTRHTFLYPSDDVPVQTLTHTSGYAPSALRLELRASQSVYSRVSCYSQNKQQLHFCAALFD
jgi:hypothetical protein